jgi:hypothetical protein
MINDGPCTMMASFFGGRRNRDEHHLSSISFCPTGLFVCTGTGFTYVLVQYQPRFSFVVMFWREVKDDEQTESSESIRFVTDEPSTISFYKTRVYTNKSVLIPGWLYSPLNDREEFEKHVPENVTNAMDDA